MFRTCSTHDIQLYGRITLRDVSVCGTIIIKLILKKDTIKCEDVEQGKVADVITRWRVFVRMAMNSGILFFWLKSVISRQKLDMLVAEFLLGLLLNLKMEALRSSETSVKFYRATRSYISEDSDSCENLRFNLILNFLFS